MNKITCNEFKEKMFEAAKKGDELHGVIVFAEDYFSEPYTVTERSYYVGSHDKYWDILTIGRGLLGDCLDGIDLGVRLDWFRTPWKVDYCYFPDAEEKAAIEKFISDAYSNRYNHR